jgi:hypothetical protein
MQPVELSHLPLDTLGEIFANFEALDRLRSTARVCKQWRDISYEEAFWEHFMRSKYAEDVEKYSQIYGTKLDWRMLFAVLYASLPADSPLKTMKHLSLHFNHCPKMSYDRFEARKFMFSILLEWTETKSNCLKTQYGIDQCQRKKNAPPPYLSVPVVSSPIHIFGNPATRASCT